jgi:hypothetical protein
MSTQQATSSLAGWTQKFYPLPVELREWLQELLHPCDCARQERLPEVVLSPINSTSFLFLSCCCWARSQQSPNSIINITVMGCGVGKAKQRSRLQLLPGTLQMQLAASGYGSKAAAYYHVACRATLDLGPCHNCRRCRLGHSLLNVNSFHQTSSQRVEGMLPHACELAT